LADPNVIGDETDPRLVGSDVTDGNEEGGRRAMENLLAKDPTINVVHTINEPAAAGAYEALRSIGRESDVLIVSVDGGCPGIQNVKDGVIGATSQQYPLLMASKGIEAIAAWAADGTKPSATDGKDFFDTGVALVTDKPVDGVESIDTTEGTNLCWG
jgi:fructose transport system substrate-binding protein